MTSGVNMGYQSDGLRRGGSQALGAGATAQGAASVLRPVACPPASLGVVAGAAALAAALARSRDAHVALAERVNAAHVDLNGRAGQAAGDGDGLTTQSAAVARTGAPTGGGGR
jgi:hypothetical protein